MAVYGVASTASASLLDIAEENEWTDEDVPYEDYEDADHGEEPYESDEEYEEDSEGEDGGSIQILGSNSIGDNESDQGPDNVFQMHGAVMDNEFYPKSEHP